MIGKIKSYDEDTQTGVIKSEEEYYEFHVSDWSEPVLPIIDSDVIFEGEENSASMVTLIGSYLDHEESVKSRKIAIALALFPLTGLFGGHRWYLCYYKIACYQILVTLFTFGAGILWPIIDGVLLATRHLDKDKQGRTLR